MVPVKSHLLRADKTHFEPMPAVRERLAQPATRRQKTTELGLVGNARGWQLLLSFLRRPQIRGPGPRESLGRPAGNTPPPSPASPGALRAPEARPLQNKPAPAWRWIKPVCQPKTSRSQMIPNCGALDFQPICHGNSKQVTVASKWASRNDF